MANSQQNSPILSPPHTNWVVQPVFYEGHAVSGLSAFKVMIYVMQVQNPDERIIMFSPYLFLWVWPLQ